MNSNIETTDKIIILLNTAIKVLRGGGTTYIFETGKRYAPHWKACSDYPWQAYSLWKECEV